MVQAKKPVAGARKVAGFDGGALSTPDNRKLVAVSETFFDCYYSADGRLLWKYPNTFSGVHGSHKAPPPEAGLIRGAFGLVGNAVLPKPVGGIWAINGNIGEWHVLTEDGFYLTRLFQGDPFKTQWPDQAVPGAILDNVPPGLGGEDFGVVRRQAELFDKTEAFLIRQLGKGRSNLCNPFRADNQRHQVRVGEVAVVVRVFLGAHGACLAAVGVEQHGGLLDGQAVLDAVDLPLHFIVDGLLHEFE